ncbi:MAG: M23 family metallopeptidase [Chitinophagaceae bacterium]|nr:M23 family metallopeptidase [Chitinophagaceae bacterium]
MYSGLKKGLKFLIVVIIIGYLIPNNISSPILQNNISKNRPESFWCYPWGESGVHKGIDIFSEKGTAVLSPVSGFVVKKGYGTIAGNYVYMIGPKWRTYYFAHLDTLFVKEYKYVNRGDTIGKVGDTGNAAGKPPHLHYAIETLLPYFWLYDKQAFEGWKKIFYLNPVKYLNFHENN